MLMTSNAVQDRVVPYWNVTIYFSTLPTKKYVLPLLPIKK